VSPGAVLRRAEGRLLEPGPPERLAALRILIGGFALVYLVVRLPHLLEVAQFDDPRFDPVGPLAWLPGPVTPGVSQAVLAASLAAGAAFVAGWRWRLSGPAFALLFLAVTTYRNSWGQVFHVENLPALHLVILAVAPAADVWSLDQRSGRSRPDQRDPSWWGWPVRLVTLVTVLAYVVAGWAKVRNGGLHWVTGDVLRNQIAHDNLRKALHGDTFSPLGAAAVRHGWLFPPLAAASLAVELGAVVALVRGRLRLVWIGSAWLFHVGVLTLMAIAFPYQLVGVAYASLLPAERLPSWLTSRLPGRRKHARPVSYGSGWVARSAPEERAAAER
jgi:hypothetical protein